MASTAATLITRTLDNMGRAATGTTRSGVTLSTKGIEWLNRVLTRMSRRHDFRELKKKYTNTTADGVKNYEFPDNYKTIIDLTLIDDYSSVKLIKVVPTQYDRVIPYPEQYDEKRPRWYIPYGTSYDLQPIPDTAYTVYCRSIQWPTIITVSTSTIDYEVDKDDIVVAGMTAEGFRYMQMYEDAAVWEGEYTRMLAEAIDLELTEPDQHYVGRGFEHGYDKAYIGEYWNDPFIRSAYL